MDTRSDLELSADDPHALVVEDFDVRGVVFVIPLDAPIPAELGTAKVPKGSLYARLEPLTHDPEDEFAFVPLSGSEMLILDKAWRSLQGAKRVAVLADIPGARYDVLFTQAMKQIGLRRVEWSAVSEALARRAVSVQRTKDTQPWRLAEFRGSAREDGEATEPVAYPRSGRPADSLPLPADDGREVDA